MFQKLILIQKCTNTSLHICWIEPSFDYVRCSPFSANHDILIWLVPEIIAKLREFILWCLTFIDPCTDRVESCAIDKKEIA